MGIGRKMLSIKSKWSMFMAGLFVAVLALGLVAVFGKHKTDAGNCMVNGVSVCSVIITSISTPVCSNSVPTAVLTSSPAPSQNQSNAVCQMLNDVPTAGQVNSFTFTSSAANMGNVMISRFVYDFGDGSPEVTETSGDTPVTHKYIKAGTFTATVTIFANISGSEMQLPTSVTCSKQIVVSAAPMTTTMPPSVVQTTVPTPEEPEINTPTQVAPLVTSGEPLVCSQLTSTPAGNRAFTFTATARSVGATVTSATFYFGDGSLVGTTPGSDGVTASASHAYAASGTYTVNAIFSFTSLTGSLEQSTACTIFVTV
jgi:PKD repeat protein